MCGQTSPPNASRGDTDSDHGSTIVTDERTDVLHSWCVQSQWDAPTIVGGRGAHLFAADGRDFLDMSSLAECSNLGHQHPRVVAAIREQAERLCFVTSAWGARPRAELARALLDRSGFDGGRVFFTLGGADANEHAVKFARQARGVADGLVVTRERSYHGATYACMAWSGDTRTNASPVADTRFVAHVPPPYAYRCPFGSSDADDCGRRAAAAVAAALDAHGVERCAAVLMEPNAGTNGIVAPDSYWPALRAATRERGVCLIADEIMSGFGRCGEWFAWQRHGEAGRPDLMTLAKGLTGAHLPLGAVVLSAAVAQRLENEVLNTGLTYCGHPLACAAGLAALAAYDDERLIERSRRLGAQMLERIRAMQAHVPSIGDVRGGSGLFVVIELVRDRATREPPAAWPDTPPALRSLVARARDAGVSFATRGNLILLAPPLVIEENELADALILLERLLTEMQA